MEKTDLDLSSLQPEVRKLIGDLLQQAEKKKLDPIIYGDAVNKYVGKMSKARRNKLIKAGLFPKPVRIVPNGRNEGWPESELLAVQERIKAERDKPYTGIKRDPKTGRIAKRVA